MPITQITAEHTLVGVQGGLCATYGYMGFHPLVGHFIETEHGTLVFSSTMDFVEVLIK